MKKLILLTLSLLAFSELQADSITPGRVGVIEISTGIVGQRNWGDKVNFNTRVFASSMNTILENLDVLTGRSSMLTLYNSLNQFVGNVTTLKFDSNLTVSVVGSTGTVSATGGGGGPVGNSTVTVTLFHSGGHVFLATSPFVAIDGLSGTPVITSTFNAFRLQAFTMTPSTVAVVKFQIVKTTALHINANISDWGPQVHSSTGAYYGVPISTRIPFFPSEGYSLHIDSIPVSGDQARTYGIKADGWFTPQ